jgi:hypothetical protein
MKKDILKETKKLDKSLLESTEELTAEQERALFYTP